eukprot:CAMPEP_0119133606 /NCGR_PEP_ID=MMETSP1310-20130426/13462_1 /TAXON_ID=464262 /ORGANISM="Genus nov. species nov., Strain RCC2339" /LENGTH=327 /DNA_ID=CAMNT_0007124305 /DNA_START=146 /DNA_END=1125 /DNA_ORIENTATION=+
MTQALLDVHVLGAPAQLLADLGVVRVHGGVVPRARLRLLRHLDGLARDLLARLHDLPHADARARPDVVQRRRVGQRRHQPHVRVNQVHHVDEVSHAGAVRGGVLGAQDLELGDVAQRGVEARAGDAPLRPELGPRVLPQQPALVAAVDVEIPEDAHAQLRVGGGQVADDVLAHELGGAVGVDGHRRRLLGDGQLRRVAVRRARGRVDEVLHARLAHALHQAQRVGGDVVVVPQRLGHALADVRHGGEVHHEVHRVLPQHAAHLGLVPQVGALELELVLAGQALEGAHGAQVAAAEIVQDDDVIPVLQQPLGGVRPDVPGAARHQHRL